MESLEENVVRIRLRQLNSSQNSIQTLSLWVAHHHNDAALVADAWLEELCTNRSTTHDWYKAMFYLVNDVVQNCRKDKRHVCDAFFGPFHMAVEKLGRRQIDKWEKIIGSVYRVLDILKDRQVYDDEQIKSLKKAINWRPADGAQVPSTSTAAVVASPKKTPKKEERKPLTPEQKMELRKKTFGDVQSSLGKLVTPASTDSAIRQKIATYPETIADTRKTAMTKSLPEAVEIHTKAVEALPLVRDYADRVRRELHETRDAQKKMDVLAEFMKIEIQRDADILAKARGCLDALHKKKQRLAKLRALLPDPNPPSGTLPEIEGDV